MRVVTGKSCRGQRKGVGVIGSGPCQHSHQQRLGWGGGVPDGGVWVRFCYGPSGFRHREYAVKVAVAASAVAADPSGGGRTGSGRGGGAKAGPNNRDGSSGLWACLSRGCGAIWDGCMGYGNRESGPCAGV